jgi:hypothetical protein
MSPLGLSAVVGQRQDKGAVTMNISTIKRILAEHGAPFYEENGQVFADSMISGTKLFEQVENVTKWSYSKLMTWLGY